MITINLMRDNNSPDCERIVEWTKSHILALNQDLICPLPDNFEDYWKNTINHKARNDYRKAIKNNITVQQIYYTKDIEDDLYNIQHSAEIRQGRPLTAKYYGKKWEPMDFTLFQCPNHYEEFWVAKKDNRAIAYTWLIICGEYIKTNSIMGHVDYWKYGTMKFMLIEILRNKIGKWNNRYFSYGTKSFLDKNLRYFCENLGLKLLGRQIING